MADIVVFRPATGVSVRAASGTNAATPSYHWGLQTDVPVPGDYDGDGKSDLAVYRPSTGAWYVLQSTTNAASYISYQWGVDTDIPALKTP